MTQELSCSRCGSITYMLWPNINQTRAGPVYQVLIICAKCGEQKGKIEANYHELHGPAAFADGHVEMEL